MKEKFLFSYYYKYSLLCAVAYCIPVLFFFNNEKFSDLWLLYLGNMLFGCILIMSGYFVNKKLNDYASLNAMITAGIKVIVSSIGIIVILVLLMATFYNSHHLRQSPANTEGLYFMLIVNMVVVNFLLGMFGVFIGAVTIKRNQKNAKGEEIT